MKHKLARPNGTKLVFRMALALGLAHGFHAQAAGAPGSFAASAAAIQAGLSARAGVADVRGVWTGDEGRVTWRLDSTWGTAGFYVYRVDPETGAGTRLNDFLLPVAFHVPDATYELADPEAIEGGAGTYRLEEVELSGAVFDLGVHAVTFAPPPPAAAIVPAPKAAAPARRDAPAGTSSVLKVFLKNEGIYGVSLESIAAGMGLPLEDVEELAAEDSLRFRSQGRPVPLLYDAARGRVLFHGQPTTEWYAPAASYLISIGEGWGMSRREPGATNGQAVFRAQIRFEEDRWPFDGVVQRPEDFYYWNFIVSTTNPASNLVDFAIGLDGYAGGELTLKVDLQGWSKTVMPNPDHHAEFSLNGTPVGSCAFNDQDAVTAVLAIPDGVAVPGTNVLTVRGTLPPGFSYSYFVLDGITAEFNRPLVPGEGTTHLQAEGAASISAAAFDEPVVLALDGERWFPSWIADENGELPDKAWAAAQSNECFAVIEAEAVPMLVPEPAAADAWFMAETNRIDYLIVTSRALAPAAQELADYRAGQGLRVGVATFEDVCDLLYEGLRSPDAIRELLSYAAAWPEPPQMIVLAGNGHYDYRGVFSNEVNHVPPMLLQTYDGLFAADELLADAGGDDLPDLAFGRLPARSAEELTAMIAKIKAYEAAGGSAWQNQWVFANDAGGAAGDFAGSVARFTNLVQNPYSVSARINLDVTPIAPARTAFLGGFNNGAGLIHYTGHGLTAKLSSQGLLTAADIAAMTNARQPIVVALACLAGHFEASAVDSVAELLMQRSEGGAVAVWASSAMSLNAPATDLGETFYRFVLQNGSNTLGGAILGARRALPGDIFTRNTYATYNLFGDPALRLDGSAATNPPPAQVYLDQLAHTYDGTPKSATATTDPAGLTVEFTYDGSTNVPVAAGTYAVVATVVDSNYAGMATGTLVVAQAAQTIDFPAIADQVATNVLGLAATASSGLPVVFAVASGPATIADGTNLTFTGTGTVTVVASQAGDANWAAATDVARAFGVTAPPPEIEIHKAAVGVREAGEGRVYVRLSRAPATNVLVGVSRSAGSTNVWVKNGTLLVFRPSNWSVWQVATLAAAADENDEDETATIRMSASGLADQFVAATALDDDLGENLARTASGATISGQTGYLAANAIDGVHTVQSNYAYTVWTNLESPGTMTLDLQGTATVARIRLLNYDWSYRVHQYRIEASPDGQAWAVVADASAGEHSGWEDWAAGPDPIRYLRFVGLSNSANRSVCVSEWEVYGERMATRLDQTIDFPAIADQVTTNVLALAATASSGLPVVFAVASGPATIADGTNLTFTGTGTVTVVASQAGDANWAAATDVARAFGVTAPPPEIEIHKAAVGVREAGEGRVYVRLSRAPATNVLVGVSRSAGSTNVWVKNGTLLVFRPSNWSVWQVATLAAAADENDEDETATIRMSASGLADQFVAATALDDDLGENLARTASGATISGQTGYLAANAIDGVHTVQSNYAYTVWTNLESPGTMTLDLQGTATVARIRLLNYDWSYRVHQYRIEASPDGQAWAVVADASAGEHSGWEDWAAGPDPIRYLRFVGLSNSANRSVCVSEWEVYGAPPAAKRAVRAPTATAQLRAADPFPLTVVTSDDGPEHTNGWAAVDGDTNTVWEGRAGAGGWHIAVGYDATLAMTNLVVDVAEGSATRMQCLFSLDGEDWRAWPDGAAAEPVEANYLWLLFPGEDEESPAPRVIEITPQFP